MEPNILINKSNPRQIRGERFEKLYKSVLSFPAMLLIRKIVYDDKNESITLGGNMRLKTLERIFKTGKEKVVTDMKKFELSEQQITRNLAILEPVFNGDISLFVEDADMFTEDEKRQFVILDNVDFGEWDTDILANEWEKEAKEWTEINWENKEEPKPTNGKQLTKCPNCGHEF